MVVRHLSAKFGVKLLQVTVLKVLQTDGRSTDARAVTVALLCSSKKQS